MSRIAKRPIPVAPGTKVQFSNRQLVLSGPKGEQSLALHQDVNLDVSDTALLVQPANPEGKPSPMLGTTYALIKNMMQGVSQGFQKELSLVGVGYRAALSGTRLELNLGFSHPVMYELPKGVSANITANTKIMLESADKQLLGQVSAEIRKFRPPEPYKGKGILFTGEVLRRKAGKSGKK
jgi:large subunit ribosomal protein L6